MAISNIGKVLLMSFSGSFSYVAPSNSYGLWQPITAVQGRAKFTLNVHRNSHIFKTPLDGQVEYIGQQGNSRREGFEDRISFVAGSDSDGFHEPRVRWRSSGIVLATFVVTWSVQLLGDQKHDSRQSWVTPEQMTDQWIWRGY